MTQVLASKEGYTRNLLKVRGGKTYFLGICILVCAISDQFKA